jgi:hypothetical protein
MNTNAARARAPGGRFLPTTRSARRKRHSGIVLIAVLAAAVFAAPAGAQGNEVTKWNEIAVTTVLAQPPITSAPPASATFIAMVQGAVYDAVNSIDQTHRPYLLTRKFDQLASQDAAAATAAFRVRPRYSRSNSQRCSRFTMRRSRRSRPGPPRPRGGRQEGWRPT